MAAKRLIPLASLIVLLVIGQGQAMPSNSRIWGGSDAGTGQYPHVVSVRVNGAHACVGSIISARHILTAGNCVSALSSTSVDPSTVTIRVGSANQFAGGEIVDCESIVIHPSYGNFLNDLAVLVLKQSLTFTDKIQKIDLATEDDVYVEGTNVSVTGWGIQETGSSPYKLQHVDMSVLGGPNCELEAGFGYNSVICLHHPVNTGFCRGDHGAGVVSGSKLVSVASFAFGSCGTKFPDVSTKVSYYSTWINNILAA